MEVSYFGVLFPPPFFPLPPSLFKRVCEGGLLKETIAPRTRLPPLLTKLSERPLERLDYLGVSYGLTAQLYRCTGGAQSKLHSDIMFGVGVGVVGG